MADYYIVETGNDSGAGGIAAPWKTLDKLNTEIAAARVTRADRVFLARGSTFYGRMNLSGLSTSGSGFLQIRPFGYGPLPEINGYKTSLDTWVLSDTNVWRLNLTAGSTDYTGNQSTNLDVGHLRVGSEYKAYKRSSLAGLVNDWDFYSDGTYVYVKRTGASPGPGVRIAIRDSGVTLGNNVDVRGLSILGFGAHGFVNSGNGNIIAANNRIEAIGGSYISGTSTRYGNGFEGYSNARKMNVTQNRIRQCFDVGMTVQGPMDGNAASEILYQGNWIENCNQSFEIWATTSGTPAAQPLNKISFVENVCVGAGRSWAAEARADSFGKGIHLLSYELPPSIDVKVKRNVFYDAKDALGWYNSSFPPIERGYDISDNSVYLLEGTKITWQDTQTITSPGTNGYVRESRLFRMPSAPTTIPDVLALVSAQAAFAADAARIWTPTNEVDITAR